VAGSDRDDARGRRVNGVRLSRGNTVRLLVLAMIWGASFLLIKLALEGVSPMQIVLGRLSFGALALGLLLAVRRQPLPREPALWGHLLLMAVVANIVPFFLFGWGEQHVTSGMAGVLNGTTPLFTLVFAMALLPEERLSGLRALGLLVGFVGVVLVVGPWRNGGENALPGQLACLGAAACYGVSFTYTRRHISGRAPVLPLSVAQLLCAAGLLWIVAPVVAWTPVELTPTVVASVVGLGAVGTGMAYALYYRLIHDAGATTASMVTYLIPVFAVALGIAVLGEPLTWNLFGGAAVVILGVLVADGRLGARPRAVVSPVVDAPVVRAADDAA
jgi:drug/metabolite transporter (DMT)-like permease